MSVHGLLIPGTARGKLTELDVGPWGVTDIARSSVHDEREAVNAGWQRITIRVAGLGNPANRGDGAVDASPV
jgi:hypothetical protein